MLSAPSMPRAAWFYYPYYAGFNIWTLLANWLKLVCFNFPFAYFTQLFFIQPTVRVIFKTVFRKDIEARAKESEESMSQKGKKPLPDDETDTVAESNGVDCIITRNKDDFEENEISCYSPQEFLEKYSDGLCD